VTLNIPPILNVFRHDTDNQALVTLTGEIDMDSAPLVRESLGQCLRDGIRTIDVDVTTATFCDCSGLNTFLHALLRTTSVGGSLHLHYPSPALERLVALTGSESLFLTLPDALAGSPPTPQPSPVHEVGRLLPPVVPVGPAGGAL
jgi:anti-sigma B factor antagonist